MLKAIAIMALTLSLLACASTTGSVSQGRDAFAKKDYHTAFDQLYPQAVDGDPRAQYAVGYILYYGKAGTQDRNQGMKWIQKSAEQGYLEAQQAWQIISQQMAVQTSDNSKMVGTA